MKVGYICGVVAAIAALVSYVIFALCVDVFGVDLLSKIGIAGRLLGHLLSLIFCLGLIVFFITGLLKCCQMEKGDEKQLKHVMDCKRLTRTDFWLRARWVYVIEFLIAFPMSISVFIWHRSFVVYSFWDTTPWWCLMISAIGLFLIIVLRALMLPIVIRRFYDCNLPKWLAVFLFIVSFAPKVWWLSSVITVMIAEFVAGTQGANRYGEDPKERLL
jgi:uncharacterized membrane protein YhaH (DUF805 family)